MIQQYGPYLHPNGECHVKRMEIDPMWSPMNMRFLTNYKLHILIQIQFTTADDDATRDANPLIERANRQALWDTKISEMVTAYAENYFSCGLLHDDGTRTRHFLDTTESQNVSGCRVLHRSWTRGDQDEYATVRTGFVVLNALRNEADSGLYSFREETSVYGTGEQSWAWVESPTLDPVQQLIYGKTRQIVIQSGACTGVDFYPIGNIPPPRFPQWEQPHRRFYREETPEWFGNAWKLYPIRWSYHMELPPAQSSTIVRGNLIVLPQNFLTVTPLFNLNNGFG